MAGHLLFLQKLHEDLFDSGSFPRRFFNNFKPLK